MAAITVPTTDSFEQWRVKTNQIAVQADIAAKTNSTNTFTENQVITVTDNVDSALAITQLGNGPCLVINDAVSDTSPTIVTNGGKWQIGYTDQINMSIPGYTTDYQPAMGIATLGGAGGFFGVANFSTSTGLSAAACISLNRSKSGVIGTHVTTANNDVIGSISASASDGTGFVGCAEMTAYVEGAVSTGVVPGGWRFNTTTLTGVMTETLRMAYGNVSLGGSAGINISFYNRRDVTGSATSYANYTYPTVKSDVTTLAYLNRTLLATQAASFVLPSAILYSAGVGSIGAGSSVTDLIGYRAESNLTSGTSNSFGFYGQIPDGAGRFNFYAAGTAPNYFAGKMTVAGGIVSTSPTEPIGYGPGAGGSITQLTSKSTAVTLGVPCGRITMASDALAAGAEISFQLNNAQISTYDVLGVTIPTASPNFQDYSVRAYVGAGNATIYIKNNGGVSRSDSVIINFALTGGSIT